MTFPRETYTKYLTWRRFTQAKYKATIEIHNISRKGNRSKNKVEIWLLSTTWPSPNRTIVSHVTNYAARDYRVDMCDYELLEQKHENYIPRCVKFLDMPWATSCDQIIVYLLFLLDGLEIQDMPWAGSIRIYLIFLVAFSCQWFQDLLLIINHIIWWLSIFRTLC